MKRILTIVGALVIAFGAMAQAPERMTYQAVVRDAQNEIVANQGVSVEVSITQTTVSGTVVFEERHSPSTNANGLFTISLGTGTPLSGSLGSIDWSQGPYFLNSNIDPTGGSSYSIQASTQLVSVPYAMYAESAGSIEDIEVYLQNNTSFDTAVTNIVNNLGISNPVVGGSVVNDSLILTLNDGTTINAGLAQGPQGPAGADGQDGAQGPQGLPGPQGQAGADGQDGAQGPQGVAGPQGATGPQGLTGPQGPQGPAGADGQDGAQGPQGVAGPQGLPGPQGPAGTGGFTHYLGEEFGGGVIFHLWRDAQGVEHGLIVDKIDLSTGAIWSNLAGSASAQSTWDGLGNSNAIVGQSGHTTSAAALCLNSTNSGQNDWYLPSIDELSLLWHCRFNVNKSLSAIGGATELSFLNSYWTSSEYNNSYSSLFRFFDGYSGISTKGTQYPVRAIRQF